MQSHSFLGVAVWILGLREGSFAIADVSTLKYTKTGLKKKKVIGSKSKTPFRTVFANDIRPDAKKAWESYFSQNGTPINGIYHLESIVDLVKKAQSGATIFPKKVDIVTGGFPCQDFSIAGKRNGFNSHRSHNGGLLEIDEPSIESRGQLYIWMRDVITITQPSMFIAENVKGLTNLDDAKQVIERDFASASKNGYLVISARVLNSADYGVPQSRERVLFFGFRKDLLTKEALDGLSQKEIPLKLDPYPQPTHAFTRPKSNILAPFVPCGAVLKDLDEPNETKDESQKAFSKAKYMGSHCQGQTEICLESVAPTIRSQHHGNIEYRRLSKEHGGTHAEELKNGLMERRLTVRECARIQTFPDNFQFVGTTGHGGGVSCSEAYQIIGNAVPCVLAYHVAMNLADKWDVYFKKQ